MGVSGHEYTAQYVLQRELCLVNLDISTSSQATKFRLDAAKPRENVIFIKYRKYFGSTVYITYALNVCKLSPINLGQL